MITDFARYYLMARGFSVHTAAAYMSDLRDFASWMLQYRADARWSNITTADINQYAYALSVEDKKPATINRRLAAISSLYNWMRSTGRVVENPCRFAGRSKVGHHLPSTIPTADIEKAIARADEVVGLAIRLLFKTGIRIGELMAINTNDIDLNNCSIRVHGKGDKERLVFMDAATADVLAEFTRTRKGPLFTENERALRYRIFLCLHEVSQARQLSPHAIRHTFATEMARKGAPTTAIAAILGHARLDTTQKYINAAGIGTQAIYNQFN